MKSQFSLPVFVLCFLYMTSTLQGSGYYENFILPGDKFKWLERIERIKILKNIPTVSSCKDRLNTEFFIKYREHFNQAEASLNSEDALESDRPLIVNYNRWREEERDLLLEIYQQKLTYAVILLKFYMEFITIATKKELQYLPVFENIQQAEEFLNSKNHTKIPQIEKSFNRKEFLTTFFLSEFGKKISTASDPSRRKNRKLDEVKAFIEDYKPEILSRIPMYDDFNEDRSFEEEESYNLLINHPSYVQTILDHTHEFVEFMNDIEFKKRVRQQLNVSERVLSSDKLRLKILLHKGKNIADVAELYQVDLKESLADAFGLESEQVISDPLRYLNSLLKSMIHSLGTLHKWKKFIREEPIFRQNCTSSPGDLSDITPQSLAKIRDQVIWEIDLYNTQIHMKKIPKLIGNLSKTQRSPTREKQLREVYRSLETLSNQTPVFQEFLQKFKAILPSGILQEIKNHHNQNASQDLVFFRPKSISWVSDNEFKLAKKYIISIHKAFINRHSVIRKLQGEFSRDPHDAFPEISDFMQKRKEELARMLKDDIDVFVQDDSVDLSVLFPDLPHLQEDSFACYGYALNSAMEEARWTNKKLQMPMLLDPSYTHGAVLAYIELRKHEDNPSIPNDIQKYLAKSLPMQYQSRLQYEDHDKLLMEHFDHGIDIGPDNEVIYGLVKIPTQVMKKYDDNLSPRVKFIPSLKNFLRPRYLSSAWAANNLVGINVNFYQTLLKNGVSIVASISSEARFVSGDWYKVSPRSVNGHALHIIGFGQGVDPYDLVEKPYFLLRDSFSRDPISLKVDAYDFVRYITRIYVVQKTRQGD